MPVMSCLRNVDRKVLLDGRVLTETQWRRAVRRWRLLLVMAYAAALCMIVSLAVDDGRQAISIGGVMLVLPWIGLVAGQLKTEDDRLRGRVGSVLRRRPASLAGPTPEPALGQTLSG